VLVDATANIALCDVMKALCGHCEGRSASTGSDPEEAYTVFFWRGQCLTWVCGSKRQGISTERMR
jgi:hypothetical protein